MNLSLQDYASTGNQSERNLDARAVAEVATEWPKVFSGSSALVLSLFALVFLACYLPVLTSTFAVADDYLWIWGALQHNMLSPEILLVKQGRPLMALVCGTSFSGATNVAALQYLRLGSIAILTALAFCFYRTMVAARHNKVAAFFVSVIACTTLAFQVYISWATTGSYALAPLVAGISFYFADISYSHRNRARRYLLAAASVLILLAAQTLFQTSSMFYWVFAAVMLFKPGATWVETRRRFVWYAGVGLIALALAYWVAVSGRSVKGIDFELPPQRSHLVRNLGGKCAWFFKQPLRSAFSFGLLAPKANLAIVSAIVIFSGLLLYLKDSIRTTAFRVALALALIPLCYLPNLVIAEDYATYRTQSALEGIVVLYAFFALLGYRKTILRGMRETFFLALLGSCAVSAMCCAFYNVTVYFAVPNELEYRVLKSFVNPQSVKLTVRQIAFTPKCVLAPRVDFEFGLPTSSLPFVVKPLDYILRHER